MIRTYVLVLLSLSLIWLQSSPAWAAVGMQRSVNAVIGDRSYFARFGEAPSPQTSEKLRIQTHLAYVENQLRESTPLVISPGLYNRRQALLNHLQTYWQRGVFPTQMAYAGRRPHFIDEQGRLCAVGYLVAKTAGLELAQTINQRYRYAYLPEMKMPELQSWVGLSGLSLTELAMIQPSYEYRTPELDGLRNIWGISSVIIGLMFIPQLFFVQMDPEQYQSIQEVHQVLTFLAIGAYTILTFSAGLSVVSGVIGLMLAGVSIVDNLIVLLILDQSSKSRLSEQAWFGQFQLADGQTAVGFHGSFQF